MLGIIFLTRVIDRLIEQHMSGDDLLRLLTFWVIATLSLLSILAFIISASSTLFIGFLSSFLSHLILVP